MARVHKLTENYELLEQPLARRKLLRTRSSSSASTVVLHPAAPTPMVRFNGWPSSLRSGNRRRAQLRLRLSERSRGRAQADSLHQ